MSAIEKIKVYWIKKNIKARINKIDFDPKEYILWEDHLQEKAEKKAEKKIKAKMATNKQSEKNIKPKEKQNELSFK